MKVLAATFIMALLLSALAGTMHFGTVQAESSITKPSVPEFTVQLIDSSYDVPTTYSTDPYTGENVTHAGYHVESKSIEVRIKNQPFTPYWIQENENNWTINFFYNIRVKGHFGQDWTEIYHPSDGFPIQSDSEYTVKSFSSTGGEDFYDTSTSVIHAPSGGQVDFQVEAMIGYVSRKYVGDYGPFSYPWVFTGETSGWSETRTITIPTSTSSPPDQTPTPTPDKEPQQTEPMEIILAVALTVTAVSVGVGLLVYFKKRHHAKINKHSEIEQSSTLFYKRLLIMCFWRK
jgi:hypothetical protein